MFFLKVIENKSAEFWKTISSFPPMNSYSMVSSLFTIVLFWSLYIALLSCIIVVIAKSGKGYNHSTTYKMACVSNSIWHPVQLPAFLCGSGIWFGGTVINDMRTRKGKYLVPKPVSFEQPLWPWLNSF